MKRRTLLGIFYPFLIAITVLPLLFLYFTSTDTVRDVVHDQSYKTIRETTFLIRNILPRQEITNTDLMTIFCKNAVVNTNLRITVMLPDGVVTGDSHKNPKVLGNHLFRKEMQKALSGGEGFSERFSVSLEIDMFYFALPVIVEKDIIAVIRVSLPFELSKSVLIKSYQRIFFITLLVAMAVSLLSYYITRLISLPISALARMTEGISSLDFNSLKVIEGPSEIYNLSVNLQKMSKILEQKFNSSIRQRKELKAVFSALIEAIIVLDEDYIIKDINNAAISLFRSNKISFQNQSLIIITRNSELNELVEKTIREKKSQYRTILLKEQINVKADEFGNHKFTSRDIYLQVNTTLIETEDRQTRIILVLHDITQVKALERIRRDFVANVSHELKTPVTSILGFIETLQNGALNNKKDAHKFLNIIQNQSIRLDLLIKDLLSLSALESSENTELTLENHSLLGLINSAIEVCRPEITKKRAKIKINCAPDLKIKINSIMMEQALINLVDNAVKYSSVECSINISGDKFSDYTLIKIADNGPGIPESDIPRVFERFYTINKARSRELGGTGLGLAIVKHIILAHKGEISINTPKTKGTEFIIRIPL